MSESNILPHASRPKFPIRSDNAEVKHVLLITTGSVASVKAPLIVKEILRYGHVRVQVASTKPSLAFFSDSELEKNNAGVYVWTDTDEWNIAVDLSYSSTKSDSGADIIHLITKSWSRIGDPILHIELRRWADVILVAPCSANTLSKLASGACDNLVTSVLRAASPGTPVYIFPAMNTQMYLHPVTGPQLNVVSETLGYTVVGPVGKGLACGDTGTGAMTEWKEIVNIVVDLFSLSLKLPAEN